MTHAFNLSLIEHQWRVVQQMADLLCVYESPSLRRSLHDDACTGTSVATSVTSRCVCVFAGARQHHAAGSATPGRTLVLAACAHAAHDVERRRRLMTSRRSRARSLARAAFVGVFLGYPTVCQALPGWVYRSARSAQKRTQHTWRRWRSAEYL